MATGFEWFNNPIPYLNVPMYVAVLLGLVIFVVFLLVTRKPKSKEYKPINLKKEIKDELNTHYKFFQIPVNKTIYSGLTKIGYAIGYMPLVWNKRMKIIENIKKNRLKEAQTMPDDYVELKEEPVRMEMDNPNPTRTIGKTVRIVDEPITMFAFKVSSANTLVKFIAQLIGVGTKYFIVAEKDVSMDKDDLHFSPLLQRQYFFGQFIFSKVGRDIIDNTSFRIDRENVLQEVANTIPRELFLVGEVSKRIALMRENERIEKDRFKSQKESAED